MVQQESFKGESAFEAKEEEEASATIDILSGCIVLADTRVNCLEQYQLNVTFTIFESFLSINCS